MVLEIFHFKVRILGKRTSPFCRFSAPFSLIYDVTDAMLQDNEKNESAIAQESFV